jgi:hypothetical protein
VNAGISGQRNIVTGIIERLGLLSCYCLSYTNGSRSGFNIKEKREKVTDGSVPLCIIESGFFVKEASTTRALVFSLAMAHLTCTNALTALSYPTVQPNDMEMS